VNIVPELTVKEVTPPVQRWCHSGHFAPESWEREGVGTGHQLTRFFAVSNNGGESVNGVYCEPCLVIAHAHARTVKQGK
jgi:hypothetical protein